MKSSFTLVTPSCDQAGYIERAVRSVLCQPDDGGVTLDHVVADAGSRDDSIERVRGLIDDVPYARIVSKPDRGAADAIARELGNASGEFVGWLNADDLLLPGALERIAATFDRSDADVVYADGYFIDRDDHVIGAYPTESHDPDFLRTFCYLSQPSVFVRRAAYEAVGGIDPHLEYCFDYELWLRLARAGHRFRHLRRFCSATRLHAETKTARRSLDFTDEIIAVQNRLFGDVPEAWLAYHDFRRREFERPERSRLRHLLAALRSRGAAKRDGRPLRRWAVRVAGAHIRAWFRALPARLSQRSLARKQ
ncbi:MAG: glycosyltransferase family 2 protein [Candidatus Wenzhouxiangella sp. M2_3B_020]